MDDKTLEFIKKAKNIHGDQYDYSKVKYTRLKDKVRIICPIHGEFWQNANNHLHGSGCPVCSKIKRTKSPEELEIKFREIHGNKYQYDWTGYNTLHDNINIFCKVHKIWFKQQAVHHLNGHGCNLCNGGGKKFTSEEFKIKAKEVHGDCYDYSKVDYTDRNSPVEIICIKHGSFWQKPHNHLNGCGCPKCKSTKAQYKLFNLICNKFPNEIWEWEFSPSWLGLQRFDIYNPKYNFAIEYNGEQHYIPVEVFGGNAGLEKYIKLDARKKELCDNNNCKLFILKYDYKDKELEDLYNNIQNIIDNEIN